MIAIGNPLNAEVMEKSRAIKGRSLWVDARRRLFRNRAAMASIIVLGLITLMAIFAPFFSAYSYDEINYDIVSCAPNWWPAGPGCNAGGTHWFGTDAVGR